MRAEELQDKAGAGNVEADSGRQALQAPEKGGGGAERRVATGPQKKGDCCCRRLL